jgi:hypothetical protein
MEDAFLLHLRSAGLTAPSWTVNSPDSLARLQVLVLEHSQIFMNRHSSYFQHEPDRLQELRDLFWLKSLGLRFNLPNPKQRVQFSLS